MLRLCLPLYEGVDWNKKQKISCKNDWRLPLYEGVDWNVLNCAERRWDGVSLFTREWIEIAVPGRCSGAALCLPLYEGVDWNLLLNKRKQTRTVSLFTREWIEMFVLSIDFCTSSVSLFTREWIEIFLKSSVFLILFGSPSLRGSGLKLLAVALLLPGLASPSLRGSGLKYQDFLTHNQLLFVSLFTREWIEISCKRTTQERLRASPSLRGSGLKFCKSRHIPFCNLSPSLRGSGLKYRLPLAGGLFLVVSLFTREWIEIQPQGDIIIPISMSSSLRGSGLKSRTAPKSDWFTASPSLRGSGLKSHIILYSPYTIYVSLFTREWIEILYSRILDLIAFVSLFTREWIEIYHIQ